jgi:hypothetical protein
MVVRMFGTRTFGRARSIPGSTVGLITEVGLAQAGNGRVVAAWHDSLRDRIYVSASRTGTRWSRARMLSRRVDVPGGLRVALGPDGRGVVVLGREPREHGPRRPGERAGPAQALSHCVFRASLRIPSER